MIYLGSTWEQNPGQYTQVLQETVISYHIRLYMSIVSTAEDPCGVSEEAQQGQTDTVSAGL